MKSELPKDDYDDHEEEAGFTIILADQFIAFFAIVLVFFTLLLLSSHDEKVAPSASTAGEMCVELSWPSRNIDIDLWGHAPHDKDAVGFTNLHSKTLDLLKDVVGFSGNPSHIMLEMICANNLTPGEWIFNAHYYGNHESEFINTPPGEPGKEVTVMMVARFKHQKPFMTTYTMKYEGEEKTLLDFVIKDNGEVDHDSIMTPNSPNHIDYSLKGGWHE